MWHEINNILPRELIYLKVLSSEFMKHHWRSFPSDCFLFAESREKSLWIWSFESHSILLNIFVPSVLRALRISLATCAGSSFLPVFFLPMSYFFCKYHELCQKSVFVRLKVCEAPNPFGASLPRFWLQFELLSGGETFFWNPVKCSGNATPNRFVTGHTRPSVPSSLCCDLQSHLDEFSALHD